VGEPRRDTAAPEVLLAKLLGKVTTPHAAGGVVFLDALPLAPVHLEADVMTPHFTGWTPKQPPGDWRSPVPVPFLVVAPRPHLASRSLPRGIEPAELEVASGWLPMPSSCRRRRQDRGRLRALRRRPSSDRRVGTEREKARAALVEAARRAKLEQTPAGRWRLELEKLPEQRLLERVLELLEKQPIEDLEDRCAFATRGGRATLHQLWRRGKPQDKSTRHGPGKLKSTPRWSIPPPSSSRCGSQAREACLDPGIQYSMFALRPVGRPH